ncbi:MAG: hypothetical protein K2Z81_10650, partial [Cyanobacteria bacterium]|nr:hypothetical protein [Cyanobacteriota bacterium]
MLTEKLLEQLTTYFQDCLTSGLSTENPDSERSEFALKALYEFTGRTKPEFVYCDSPFDMALKGVDAIRQNRPLGQWVEHCISNEFKALLQTRLDEILCELQEELGETLLTTLDENLRFLLHKRLVENLHDPIAEQFFDHATGKSARASTAIQCIWITQYFTERLAVQHFYREHLTDKTKEDQLFNHFVDLCMNTHAILPTEEICFISRPPVQISLNAEGQLHCVDGPALVYMDGYEFYRYDGAPIRFRHVFDLRVPLLVKASNIDELLEDCAAPAQTLTISDIARADLHLRDSLIQRFIKARCPGASETVKRIISTVLLSKRLKDCVIESETDSRSRANGSISFLLNKNGLHSKTGPAIAFPDGFALYCVNGTMVKPHVVKSPEEITIDEVLKEEDLETRQAMIYQYLDWRYGLDSLAGYPRREVLEELINFSKEQVARFKELYDHDYYWVGGQGSYCLLNERPI